MTFAVSGQGFDGLLRSVLVTDGDNQKEPYTLYVFNAQPSTLADDAAFMPTVADLNKVVTTVSVGTADYTTSDSTYGWALIGGHEDGAMEIPVHSDNGNLYIYAVAGDTPDYTAADALTFTVSVEAF